MIKKGLILIVIAFVTKLLISCCIEHISFDKIDFKAVKYDSYWYEIDTFKTEIIFEIYLYQDRYAFLKAIDCNNLYATSCGHDYQNSMDTSTIDIRSDKQIVVDNDTIKPNSNLWTNPLFKPYIKYYEDDVNPNFIWLIKIKDEGLKKMRFENSKYNFNFSVRMTDSKIISDSTSVYIKI